MVYLKVFSVLYVLITVGKKGVESPAGNSEPRLKLSDQGSANRDSYKELHGCYHHSVDRKLCFDIGSDFMKLSSTNGRTLVYLRGPRDGLSDLLQILDGHFIHRRSQSFLVALPNDFEAEEFLVDLPRQHAYNYTSLAGTQQLLEAKLTKLRDTPEMMLLELLSAALGHQKHQIKALLRFHAMSRALLNYMNIQLAPEFRAADLNRMRNGRRKRCADLQSNSKNECLGMCGPGCGCWSWVCGDCCEHIGCQQHDTCCRVGGMISTRCLLPFFYEFSCSSYGGYPDCLN